jgi:hypothetical protein
MRHIITTTLFFFITGITTARAQLQVEFIPTGGYPFMLSGRNSNNFGSATARLQLSIKRTEAPWQPYIAAAITAMELPLHNKKIDNLSLPVLHTAFKVGLNGVIKTNESGQSLWSVGGGIGICRVSPDEATLRMNGQETFLGYTTLKDQAWFPQVELGTRLVRFPKPDLGWYFGVQVFVESIWLKDKGQRYTTSISGSEYGLSFNDVAIWPSVGGVIGWSF